MLVLIGYGSALYEAGGVAAVGDDYGDSIPRASDVALLLSVNTNDASHVVNLRRVEINRLFREGGRLILLVGPQFHEGLGRQLGQWLRGTLGLNAFRPDAPLDVRPLAPHLAKYLHDQVAHAYFSWRVGTDVKVLAEAADPPGSEQRVVALRFPHERAEVIVLPVRTSISPDELYAVAQQLPSGDEYPDYLDTLTIGGEDALRDELAKAQERIEQVKRELEDARRAKRILYFTDDELQNEVVRFLDRELEIPARVESGNREDFWLLNDGGDEWCIGEVKGPGNSNLTRADVGALMDHRQRAGRPEDFPGLLVGNTFHRRRSIQERDERIPDRTVELARSVNILVVRTLDLFRLKKLLVERGVGIESFLEAIRGGGGWLEIDSDLKVEWHKP